MSGASIGFFPNRFCLSTLAVHEKVDAQFRPLLGYLMIVIVGGRASLCRIHHGQSQTQSFTSPETSPNGVLRLQPVVCQLSALPLAQNALRMSGVTKIDLASSVHHTTRGWLFRKICLAFYLLSLNHTQAAILHSGVLGPDHKQA